MLLEIIRIKWFSVDGVLANDGVRMGSWRVRLASSVGPGYPLAVDAKYWMTRQYFLEGIMFPPG